MMSRLTSRCIFLLVVAVLLCPLSSFAFKTPQDSLSSLLKRTDDPGKQCEIYVHLADLCEGGEDELPYWEKALSRALIIDNQAIIELAFDHLIFNYYWYGKPEMAKRFAEMAEKEVPKKKGGLLFAYIHTFQTYLNLKDGDINEILQEELEKLRAQGGDLTEEERVEWEFLTALSIDCNAVANGAYEEVGEAIPYVKRAIALLSPYPLEQRYPLELLCYRKLANLYMATGNMQESAAVIEKIMLLHKEEKTGQKKSFGFDRIYYNDDGFYYEEYSRLLCLTDLPMEQVEEYFSEFIRLQKRLNEKDRMYWETVFNYYMYKQDYKKALLYNDSVIMEVRENGRLTDWVDPYKVRSELYKRMGDYKQALYWLEECDSIRALLHSKEIRQSVNEIRTRFSLDKLTMEKMEADGNTKMTLLIGIFVIALCVIAWSLHQRLMLRRLKQVQYKLLKSNEEVTKQSRRAEESEKMKTAFIDSMCHEIRTPLNAINGFTELCFSGGVDDAMKAECQKEIQTNTYRLTGLLDTMLELSKLVSSDEALPVDETDVYGICMQQVDVLRSRNVKSEVECVFQGTPCPCVFYSNASYFSKVISHLLDNAIKFTEKGKVLLTCTPNMEKRCMEISVSDTGIGISPDKQEWVFERFTKVDAFVPGTGLGLYLCKLIINKLRGNIKVDSTYKTGCKIVIELPCQSPEH